MNYRVLSAALDDPDQIDEWVTEHFGSSVAMKTQVKLFHEFDLLADFPQMGRSRPEITARPVRFFLSGYYWIIYEPVSPLLIHRVFHAAQDLPRIVLT